MKRILSNILYHIDLSRHVSNHLVGEHHTVRHRQITGVFIIVIGEMIAKSVSHDMFFILQLAIDGVGYGLHAIGMIPFVARVEKKLNYQKTKSYDTTVEEVIS